MAKIIAPEHSRAFDPALDCFAGVLSDLKLNGPLGLALHDRSPLLHIARDEDIPHFEPDEVIAAEIAVDRRVEQGKIADVVGNFRDAPGSPDMLW